MQESNLAPIVLFAYNRPKHTQKVLDALAKNEEAKDSLLHIYIDGPKTESAEGYLLAHQQVCKIAKTENRFKKVHVHESAKNLGLSKSIIRGVTEVVNEYGKIIVVEDDILVAVGFLKYMNDALRMYYNDLDVGCIHAWNYPLKRINYKKQTFFLKGTDCWGWSTWNDRWDLFESDGEKLLNEINDRDLSYTFNRRDTIDYIGMLRDQIDGKVDSWAIRWDASMLLNSKLCLYPTIPIVNNIGFDGSGVHGERHGLKQNLTSNIDLQKIPVLDNEWFYSSYRHYRKQNLLTIIKGFIKKILFASRKK